VVLLMAVSGRGREGLMGHTVGRERERERERESFCSHVDDQVLPVPVCYLDDGINSYFRNKVTEIQINKCL
jgi:hypothetical protein